ncbi:MAG: tetratricopeptide repeat protein [FCB group bacterium]|nr:tetratricopeptide repeat protein [FCB group bacterium]
MLKPKKKLRRKEIKKDPLLETIYEAQQWLKDRRKLLSQVGTGLVILIIALVFLTSQRSQTHETTATQLGQALVALQNNDSENAKYILQLLVDEHGNTQDGIRAQYLLGKLHYDEGDFDAALPYIEAFLKSGDNEIMLTNAAILSADIYLSQDNLTKAEEAIKRISKVAEMSSDRYRLTLELARIYASTDDEKSKVKSLLDPLIEDQKTPVAIKRQAEELIGRAMS